MDEIAAELLGNTAALGVWLLGRSHDVLAAAVKDSSIEPPTKVLVDGESYFEFADWQVFAEPIGGATLVVMFDDRSSLGLVRLRVRHAKDAIQRALAPR